MHEVMMASLTNTEIEAFETFEKSGWEKAATPYHNHWGMLSRQSIEPMLDAALVSEGSRVLDVATGAGYAAAVATKRGATATGIDFSKAQVKLARQTYPGIEFQEGNAENLQFEANSFEAVVMGFGINHLPDPEAVFSEVFHILKPGGKFAFTVWAKPEAGTGFGIVLSEIDRHGSLELSLPPAPPYFRFADPQEAGRIFEQAGFVEAVTQIAPQYWHHSTPDEVFDAFNEGAVRVTAMLKAQPTEVSDKIRSAVRNEVLKLRQGNVYVVPAPAALSSARKP